MRHKIVYAIWSKIRRVCIDTATSNNGALFPMASFFFYSKLNTHTRKLGSWRINSNVLNFLNLNELEWYTAEQTANPPFIYVSFCGVHHYHFTFDLISRFESCQIVVNKFLGDLSHFTHMNLKCENWKNEGFHWSNEIQMKVPLDWHCNEIGLSFC